MAIDLSGVGTKYEIDTPDGKVAVVFLDTGKIQLYILEKSCGKPCCVTLTAEEARRVASVLSGSILEREEEGMELSLPGLAELRIAVHTYTVPKRLSGKSIGELGIRSKTGATVIAVLKKEKTIISPSPETVLEPGDKVVVIGEKHQIENFEKFLRD
ncbi:MULTISPECIES: cation:proton antiporter regulatory subunit [Archaeoglobus]|jgi:TrkA domain protein|nr:MULTISPECIES: cation:proton antiporter regulatory subunit [Archaeoglobus]AIG98115.1 Putative regulatory, ligand-binding protein [Archaeoglobus fulgidus DSM 8774]KUJ93123.1 MAG: hypothetical protein XD40_1689 [Archaeoglobus fulgidus]KUK06203.1 MAG: hypothetical protein XD48_1545 [Archaeoglobus fulgidus]MDI3498751.1 TrkA domain protein [Archaeoglobus sp.]